MAALPAIKTFDQKTSSSTRSNSSHQNIKFMTWREVELMKQQKIRNENPTVGRADTATFRNSYLHNLCISMLKSGFHKSFEELFNLIEDRKRERMRAGSDSVLWQESSLEEQETKLDELWQYLTKAEAAARIEKWDEVHEARTHLAEFFLQTGDAWLSDYFFKSALDTSLEVRLDGRRREAEANCRVGLAYERKGNLEKAALHMEEFYQLSSGRAWLAETGIHLASSACRHLSRIYSALAEQASDPREAQPLLHRALTMAKEGEDAAQMATTALALGRNYEANKDSESAIQYLMESLQTAQAIRDEEVCGQGYEALARSYLTQGNLPRALEFLDLYARTSQSNDYSLEFIEACAGMGKIYNSTGVYDKAVEHFGAAYDQSCAIMRDDELSKVNLGVAIGNMMLNDFKRNTDHSRRIMMSRIVSWKDERVNEFGKSPPTNEVSQTPPPPTTPDPTQPFRETSSR